MAAVIQTPPPFAGIRLVGPRHLRPVGAPHIAPSGDTARPQPLPSGVYRRRRVVAGLLAVTVLIGLVRLAAVMVSTTSVVTAGPVASAPEAAPPAAVVPITVAGSSVYVVHPGDTMWSIARRLQPDGDVRPLVDHLSRRHGGSALQVGERLDLDALRA